MTERKPRDDSPDRKKSAVSNEIDYLVDRDGHVFKAREADHGAADDDEATPK